MFTLPEGIDRSIRGGAYEAELYSTAYRGHQANLRHKVLRNPTDKVIRYLGIESHVPQPYVHDSYTVWSPPAIKFIDLSLVERIYWGAACDPEFLPYRKLDAQHVWPVAFYSLSVPICFVLLDASSNMAPFRSEHTNSLTTPLSLEYRFE